MRVVGEVSHPEFKVTLFSWNNRYLVKFEQGYLEQTYKIDQFDVSGDDGLRKLLDPAFLNDVSQRFRDMENAWTGAQHRADDPQPAP
jgi:hypothetical protein